MTTQPATQWIATSDRSPTEHDLPILVWMNQWCRTSEPLTLTKVEQFGPQYNWWKSLDRPPAPPPRELSAFEQKISSFPFDHCFKSDVAKIFWDAAVTHATEAERARFSEGVEKWIEKYAHVKYCLGTWCEMGDDLRALAAGNGEGK